MLMLCTFYSSRGSLFKKLSVIGRDTIADAKYAIGCAISIPRTPKKLGNIRHRGINTAPLCRQERIRAEMLFPIL